MVLDHHPLYVHFADTVRDPHTLEESEFDRDNHAAIRGCGLLRCIWLCEVGREGDAEAKSCGLSFSPATCRFVARIVSPQVNRIGIVPDFGSSKPLLHCYDDRRSINLLSFFQIPCRDSYLVNPRLAHVVPFVNFERIGANLAGKPSLLPRIYHSQWVVWVQSTLPLTKISHLYRSRCLVLYTHVVAGERAGSPIEDSIGGVLELDCQSNILSTRNGLCAG
jgi:hypothetical protein